MGKWQSHTEATMECATIWDEYLKIDMNFDATFDLIEVWLMLREFRLMSLMSDTQSLLLPLCRFLIDVLLLFELNWIYIE